MRPGLGLFLLNFNWYEVQLMACENQTANDNFLICHDTSKQKIQTKSNDKADDIKSSTFKIVNITSNGLIFDVTLTWEKPLHPNGLIIAYEISFTKEVRFFFLIFKYVNKCIYFFAAANF